MLVPNLPAPFLPRGFSPIFDHRPPPPLMPERPDRPARAHRVRQAARAAWGAVAGLVYPDLCLGCDGRLPPNADGHGGVSLRQLLRSALRLRPDRIVVGEVRGAEALDMVWALNTGHLGSLSTVHANSPSEALWRLETLALSDGGFAADAVRRQIQAGIHLVVQVERSVEGRRINELWEAGA